MDLIIILDFFENIFSGFYNLINLLFSSLINGLKFFLMILTYVPNYFFDLFYDLPMFFRIGFTGVFGLLLFVLIFKLLKIINLK